MNFAIILAGGTGSRAGGPLPKQFQMVHGRRMLWWSVEAFLRFDSHCRIVLVVHPRFLESWEDMMAEEEAVLGGPVEKVPGGATRFDSVKNGLGFIRSSFCDIGRDDTVFIHDAARPFVTPELILRGASVISEGVGAVPAVPLTDSIRRLLPDGSVSVPRADFVAVQTPQIFRFDDISRAYASVEDSSGLTDDASVAERAGISIRLYEGDPANRKITIPEDFKWI